MNNPSPTDTTPYPGRRLLDMNGYQWTVLFAAWLGWGFDIFDGLLFNFVAPNCVPTLLGLKIGSPEAQKEVLRWNGILASLLLLGWAAGGIIFGYIADRLGRTRTLLLTMVVFSIGTAACAFAPNIYVLLLCRLVASLGIGGEWAAGAAMVAEVVPEKRRVEAGALLYTSAPVGLLGAGLVVYLIQGIAMKGQPEVAWRYVFLCGLLPAAVAFLVRLFVKEPERWKHVAAQSAPPRLAEIFTPELRRKTIGGLLMAIVALVMWWSSNTFIPIIASGLAAAEATSRGLAADAATLLKEQWKVIAINSFNLGGFLGTLLTIPLAKTLGRRPMFGIYFVASAISIFCAFGLKMPGETRLYMYFPIGLSVFGVFGSFTYYLPELFPTRLRGTGAGFCYNTGRILAAIGPFYVGYVASLGKDSLATAMETLFWVGLVPVIGLFLLPLAVETRGRVLED